LKIALITGLVDANIEDSVVAALVADEFVLGTRCYSITQLQDYLASTAGGEQRSLLVVDDEFGLNSRDCAMVISEQRALLKISSHISLTPEEIKARAREALRSPEVSPSSFTKYRRRKNFIALTGSSGSPGISTIALNLAFEISELRNAILIDADPYRRDIHQRLGLQSSDNLQITPQLSVKSFSAMNDAVFEDVDAESIYILDIGQVPQLSELLTDRRSVGREYFELLQQCGQVIFISQSENSSLAELEQFRRSMDENLPESTVTFILNKSGSSNRQRAIQKSFKSRLGSDQTFVFPRDYPVLDRAQSQYSTLAEVAPRSGLRRAIRELSIYLAKSF